MHIKMKNMGIRHLYYNRLFIENELTSYLKKTEKGLWENLSPYKVCDLQMISISKDIKNITLAKNVLIF